MKGELHSTNNSGAALRTEPCYLVYFNKLTTRGCEQASIANTHTHTHCKNRRTNKSCRLCSYSIKLCRDLLAEQNL